MASYDEWNQALLSYFVEGIPRSAAIYLSVDDDVLAQVGRDFLGLDVRAVGRSKRAGMALVAVDDFCSAVRYQTVRPGDRLELSSIRGRNDRDEPAGLAFLCAMVLAASRMAEEDVISELNYFLRLREVLGLMDGQGRPSSMSPGAEAEEPLWHQWNLWLQERSFLPSARAGDGPRKYISYPLSQALLRRTDRDRLCRLFYNERWNQDWDADTLAVHVRRQAPSLPQHLRELFDAEANRRQAVTEALYEVYAAWREDPQPGATPAYSSSVNLRAGLFRSEDVLFGTVDYHLYPRTPMRRRADHIRVQQGERLWALTLDRPGWYQPLGPVSEAELRAGERYRVEHPSDLDWLILPQRRFWVLIPDPENPGSGAYASWGAPQLAEPFALLCTSELVLQLEHLRSEGLIMWSGIPVPRFGGSWVEVHDCLAISEAWSGVFIEDQELYDALRPRMALSVSASGGLRVADKAGWVDEYGPQLTIFGFDAEAELRVTRVADGQVIFEQVQATNIPFPVSWPGPGDYRVEASAAGHSAATRLIKLVSYQDLHLIRPTQQETLNIAGWRVCGAAMEPMQ
jgi:hypothetical protein